MSKPIRSADYVLYDFYLFCTKTEFILKVIIDSKAGSSWR